jgi:hypothetical protein
MNPGGPGFRNWRLRGPAAAKLAGVATVISALFAVTGCDTLGGRTVTVDFASAEGIEAGVPVFFAGVLVGETRDPVVIAGRAAVPVRLSRRHREALPRGAAFAIGTAPDGSGRGLIGYDLGPAVEFPNREPDTYPGFASEFELTLLVGVQQAREFWEALGHQ